MKNRKGFTIVELVIVIAVIAILAAVLIPTFSGVINKANGSARQQEITNALKAVLAGNTEGYLDKDTIFVLSEKKIATYYAVYNGNKLGELTAADATDKTLASKLGDEKNAFKAVIIGYNDTKHYDADALGAIKSLYNVSGEEALTVTPATNEKQAFVTVGNVELTVIINTDLSSGTFVLVP